MVIFKINLDIEDIEPVFEHFEKKLKKNILMYTNKIFDKNTHNENNFSFDKNVFSFDENTNFSLNLLSSNDNTDINKYFSNNNSNFTNVEYIRAEFISSSTDNKFIDFSYFPKLKKIKLEISKKYNFKFPNNIEIVDLCDSNYFNDIIELPYSIKELYFGKSFNKSVDNLPSKLEILSFSSESEFNLQLLNLPIGLKKIFLGNKFNQYLDFYRME